MLREGLVWQHILNKLTDTNVSCIVSILTDTFVSVNRGRGKMTFSEHILQLRKAKGISQTALASEIGVSWRAYQTYERGLREPQMSTLIALADFYDLSVDELICRER